MHEVIVFGGNGLVGSSLVSHLNNSPYKVLAPSSTQVDLLNINSVIEYAKFISSSSAPKSIIFVAAAVPYSARLHDDYTVMFNNVIMANNLHKYCSLITVKEIIYISTLDVYDKTNAKLTENSPVGPLSNYAIFKLTSEFLLKKFAKVKAIPFCCLRLSHVYGVNDKSPKVINKFFDSAFKTSTITVSGDKDTLRDFIYCDDVAKVISSFILKQVNDTVNVATGRAVTINFLAESIGSCFPKKININYIDQFVENYHVHFNISHLKKYYAGEFEKIESIIPLLYESKKNDYIF